MLPLRYNKYTQASSLFIACKALTTEDVCTYYVPCTMYVHVILHGDPAQSLNTASSTYHTFQNIQLSSSQLKVGPDQNVEWYQPV